MLIEPSPEQFSEWLQEVISLYPNHTDGFIAGEIARRAYRAGADMELEGCEKVILDNKWFADPSHRLAELRAARRPKPPSLKEEALEALEQIDGYAIDQLKAYVIFEDLKRYACTIRRALARQLMWYDGRSNLAPPHEHHTTQRHA